MRCSFRDHLKKVTGIENEGCRGFKPSMTSNGLCYTFNGQSGNKLWRPSEVMDTFNHLFPHEVVKNENFGGVGRVQGKMTVF